jgi:biopolymer transport protein ExbB/TolQ
VVGIIIAAVLGWAGRAFALDATKISVLISLVFVGASAWCGILAARLDRAADLGKQASGTPEAGTARKAKTAEDIYKQTRVDIGHGEYAASICLKLGLLGTVIGLTMTFLSAFTGFQGSSPEAIKALIDQLAAGTATAFITTIIGLIGSLMLSVQYHLLKQTIARLES